MNTTTCQTWDALVVTIGGELMKEMKLTSWNRFVTRNLTVVPDVMGRSHTFHYKNAVVTISVPPSERANACRQSDEVAHLIGWMRATNEPLEYEVMKVDVEVNCDQRISLNPDVLTVHPNSYDLIGEPEQAVLNGFAEHNTQIANEAFELWVETLRWVKDDFRIGRHEVIDNETGWSTYLREAQSKHRVWSASQPITVYGTSPLSMDDWKKVQETLHSRAGCPSYISLLHDAEEHAARFDYRRALIDLAVSCEIFLRYQVLDRLPDSVDTDIRTMLEEANINQYVQKYFPNRLTDGAKALYKPLKEELSSLFDARNKIMHMHLTERANADSCLRFAEVCRRLFSLHDQMK